MTFHGLRWMIAVLALGLVPLLATAQDDQERFDFPPEVTAEEEAEAQAEASAETDVSDAPPADVKPAPVKPAKAKTKPAAKPKPQAQPAKPGAKAGTVEALPAPAVALPPVAAEMPKRLADYGLCPEELCSASKYETPAQRVIAQLLEAGETDVEELVKTIVTERGNTLDHIVINVAKQRIYECNVNGEVLHEDKVSTGRKGFDTPRGTFSVHTKSPKAYSQKYTAWMLQWMGITSDGSYGMHGLEGSSYEKHLGNVASHGCIRLSRKYAKELYPRVKVGMPVKIVYDKDLVLPEFTQLSEEEARALVLDTLSPSDPEKMYY
jgi:lipoprotein-anchoring transpeptidase ErfK/SrfK